MSDDELHSVLRRQLRHVGATRDRVPDLAMWDKLLEAVNRAYRASDADRYTIERSLELSSAEMKVLYDRLSDERNRLERELETARVLQTSLLPRDVGPPYLALAGKMLPATEVGGDYYDIVPVAGACWLAIGDVTGHGLRAAIVMLMVQSMVAALVRAQPELAPSQLLALVNRGLWDGLRHRLAIDDHVTCTLLRCTEAGRIQFAGAHESILIIRRGQSRCERVATIGTWLGVTEDVSGINRDSELALDVGDLMVLYTDGLIEARNAAGQELGIDRLAEILIAERERAPAELCDRVFRELAGWSATHRDDLTMLAVRYLGA